MNKAGQRGKQESKLLLLNTVSSFICLYQIETNKQYQYFHIKTLIGREYGVLLANLTLHAWTMYNIALVLSTAQLLLRFRLSLHLAVYGLENTFFTNTFVSSYIQDELSTSFLGFFRDIRIKFAVKLKGKNYKTHYPSTFCLFVNAAYLSLLSILL